MSARPGLPLRVTVWNEFRHERHNEIVRKIYPDGMHAVIAASLNSPALDVRTATLDEPEQGLPVSTADEIDVLVWWGHTAHEEVPDTLVDRLHQTVLEGMGLIVLHSACHSRLFRRLMGTTCNLKWRDAGERERVWIVDRGHPIANGLPESFVLEREEMYGEPWEIPTPDELVMLSWFEGGEVFRTGCCYRRGLGRIFYFRPGHETFPTFYSPDVQKVIRNAVEWCAPGPPAAPCIGPTGPLEGAARPRA